MLLLLTLGPRTGVILKAIGNFGDPEALFAADLFVFGMCAVNP